jgi:hypothetical protein
MPAKVPLSSEAVVCANLEIKFTQQLPLDREQNLSNYLLEVKVAG